MHLIERDHHDHPDFDQLLPRIGCNICGHAVQSVPPHRELYRAAYQVTDDEEALQRRSQFEGPMGAWSREHAKTHSDQEHQDAQRLLRG